MQRLPLNWILNLASFDCSSLLSISKQTVTVKAYIRKATVLFTMKDFAKAMEAVGQASDADSEKKHTAEIEGLAMKINMSISTERAGETEEETLQRAMRDPEVAVRLYIRVIRKC